MLARELPLAADVSFLSVPIGHQGDVEDFPHHQPRWEELSDQEFPAAGAQSLIVEAHVDQGNIRLLGRCLQAQLTDLAGGRPLGERFQRGPPRCGGDLRRQQQQQQQQQLGGGGDGGNGSVRDDGATGGSVQGRGGGIPLREEADSPLHRRHPHDGDGIS